ncbi:hypothetical protein CR513_02089, partial [Mucuna pruriens]
MGKGEHEPMCHAYDSNAKKRWNLEDAETLFSNLETCTFCTHKVLFVGFVVGSYGLKVDEEKVKAIHEWPTPKTDVGFKWEKNQERAFQALKERLTQDPILALLNFTKSF